MSHVIVYCTCPEGALANQIAATLVDERLAACVNIVPGLRSVYTWRGQRESADENLLLIKTRRDLYPKLEARLRTLHPYELPEIVMVGIEAGLPGYLAWIDESLSK